MGTSQICSQLVKNVGGLGTPKVCLASEVEAVLWKTEPSTCGVCSNSGVSTRIGLQYTRWYQTNGLKQNPGHILSWSFLNFKSKNLLSKGVKRLVPKLRNGQICLHWRKNTGFGQLQIQTWLPGGRPPGSTPFMLSCYWPEHNSEVQSCYCHSWTHCCCLSFAPEKWCYHRPESLHACHLRPPYHKLPSQQPTHT